jgi:hypothetical protein
VVIEFEVTLQKLQVFAVLFPKDGLVLLHVFLELAVDLIITRHLLIIVGSLF